MAKVTLTEIEAQLVNHPALSLVNKPQGSARYQLLENGTPVEIPSTRGRVSTKPKRLSSIKRYLDSRG